MQIPSVKALDPGLFTIYLAQSSNMGQPYYNFGAQLTKQVYCDNSNGRNKGKLKLKKETGLSDNVVQQQKQRSEKLSKFLVNCVGGSRRYKPIYYDSSERKLLSSKENIEFDEKNTEKDEGQKENMKEEVEKKASQYKNNLIVNQKQQKENQIQRQRIEVGKKQVQLAVVKIDIMELRKEQKPKLESTQLRDHLQRDGNIINILLKNEQEMAKRQQKKQKQALKIRNRDKEILKSRDKSNKIGNCIERIRKCEAQLTIPPSLGLMENQVSGPRSDSQKQSSKSTKRQTAQKLKAKHRLKIQRLNRLNGQIDKNKRQKSLGNLYYEVKNKKDLLKIYPRLFKHHSEQLVIQTNKQERGLVIHSINSKSRDQSSCMSQNKENFNYCLRKQASVGSQIGQQCSPTRKSTHSKNYSQVLTLRLPNIARKSSAQDLRLNESQRQDSSVKIALNKKQDIVSHLEREHTRVKNKLDLIYEKKKMGINFPLKLQRGKAAKERIRRISEIYLSDNEQRVKILQLDFGFDHRDNLKQEFQVRKAEFLKKISEKTKRKPQNHSTQRKQN